MITALSEVCSSCSETITHYWVDDDPEDLTINQGIVRHYDADQETLIIEDVNANGTPLYAISFDSEDQFNDDDGDPNTQDKVPVSYQAFKEALVKAEAAGTQYNIDVEVEGTDPGDVNRFTL